MKKSKKIKVTIGIIFIITAILLYFNIPKSNTAIIGGADSPTFIFLMKKHGIIPVLSPVFIIAGVVSVIVLIVLKKKRK